NKLWSAYISEAQNYDQGLLEGWCSEMDGLLIFAGLFSGVITTFIIDSYKLSTPIRGVRLSYCSAKRLHSSARSPSSSRT
ncbi:unnamed protein product, partial [Mycena citricolor]